MKIDESTIVSISPSVLMSQDLFYSITEIEEPEERERMTALLEIKAKEMGLQAQFKRVLKAYNKVNDTLQKEYTVANRSRNGSIELDYTSDGKPATSIDNFVRILEGDEKFAGIKYNLLTYQPEQDRNGENVPWADKDDAEMRRYIELTYKIHSKDKSDDAFRIVAHKHEYHPIRDIVLSLKWDGEERCEHFLHKWTHCDDTPYTQEVSRLIFAGGINRLFHPGCKFDEMPILIGTRQGEGKSTLVRWLAMDDRFFAEVNEFDGQRGMEALDGAWVCEVGELLAMTRTKEQEAIKSFLTRMNDRRRDPYDRRTTDHLRQVVFIGTTNKRQCLVDKTGNRRFFPVEVRQTGYELFDHKKEVQADIRQCWAEAYAKMLEGKMPAYANRDLIPDIRAAQTDATEDDYRVGMIEGYLEGKAATCVLELWRDALGNSEYSKPTPKESQDIGLIMQRMTGWEKQAGTRRFPQYGPQRYWKRVCGDVDKKGLIL